MAIENGLNQVLRVLRSSSLHFSAQETQHSLYISVRKKLIENKEISSQNNPSSIPDYEKKIQELSKRCETSENAHEAAKRELEKEISDHEETIIEKNKLVKQLAVKNDLKKENEELKADIINLDSELKLVMKNVKSKGKELHDLKKANEIVNENLKSAKGDLKMLSVKVKKYEKDEENKSKVKQCKDTLNNLEFPCEICVCRFESLVKLNVHVKLEHCKANSTQTDELLQETKCSQTKKDIRINQSVQTLPSEEKETYAGFPAYSCFYCDRVIDSSESLTEPRERCRMTPIGLNPRKFNFSTPDASIPLKPKIKTKFESLPVVSPSIPPASSFSFPVGFPHQPSFSHSLSYPSESLHLPICEHCGWQSGCGTDLVNHKKAVHGDFRKPI